MILIKVNFKTKKIIKVIHIKDTKIKYDPFEKKFKV